MWLVALAIAWLPRCVVAIGLPPAPAEEPLPAAQRQLRLADEHL